MTRAAVNKRQANRAVPLAHPAVNTGMALLRRAAPGAEQILTTALSEQRRAKR
jgi:hypothetical protein